MSLTAGLTRELFDNSVSRESARRFLRERVQDDEVTRYVAGLVGNDNPRAPKTAFYDRSIEGTGILAWYLDPQDVKRVHPAYGTRLEAEIGTEPIMAYNPRVVKRYLKGEMSGEEMDSIDNHEKGHGGQPAKPEIKSVHALTQYGVFPLGTALLEGHNEWSQDRYREAMAKRGKKVPKAPTRYFEDKLKPGQPVPHYVHYRNFVYELEDAQPGVMRQFFRAAKRAGMKDAIRILENVKGVDKIVEKYASKLSQGIMN